MPNHQSPDSSLLIDLLSDETRAALTVSGKNIITNLGIDIIRGVVLDVLTGRNIRNSTEILTRRRIAALNLATLHLFLQGSQVIENFVERLPALATEVLRSGKLKKEERWLAQWILGLTDKGFQNILRDERQLLESYRDSYVETCRRIIEHHTQTYGELTGHFRIGDTLGLTVNWLFMVYLLNTTGAQTLTVRGADKSAYGKLFEKLVLGSLLHILGFEFQPDKTLHHLNRVFWLSSRNSDKRESDATLLYEAGKGVRFDIGFIGRGNTEISLDKVSRYQREIQLGRENWFMATIIVVDRIGERSNIQALADEIDGTIVQMSGGYWPQRIALRLHEVLGFEHPLLHMTQAQVGDYLRTQMPLVPLHAFIDFV